MQDEFMGFLVLGLKTEWRSLEEKFVIADLKA